MALSSINGLFVKGIVSVLAQNQQDNQSLTLVTPEERIALVNHTGIRFRRVAKSGDTIQAYFTEGIKTLLPAIKWEIDEIDILLCVSQPKETQIPSISNQIHGELCFKQQVLCFDINSGCSGYPYGIHTIASLLKSLNKKNAKGILCVGDLSTQLINPTDKSTVPIFSDVVSVTALEIDTDKPETSYFNLETLGAGQKAIYAQNGVMHLNGIDVFNYAVQYVPNHIKKLMDYAGHPMSFPNAYVLHQANKLINDAIVKRIGVDAALAPTTLYEYGNSASASIPLTLGKFCETTKVDTALLCGFGVGFSIASALVHLSANFVNQRVEL